MFNDLPIREMDSTRKSASDEQFEQFLKQILAAGAELVRDEETPLFYDTGREEVEIGVHREVEFNLNRTDFLVLRDVKNRRILGAGNKRTFEELSVPIIDLKLKKKSELAERWEFVDVDELFK